MNKTVAAAFRLAIQDWTSGDLAALNLGMGFGTVPKGCQAYAPAVEAGLIAESGQPVDAEALSAALSVEINDRLDKGTWE